MQQIWFGATAFNIPACLNNWTTLWIVFSGIQLGSRERERERESGRWKLVKIMMFASAFIFSAQPERNERDREWKNSKKIQHSTVLLFMKWFAANCCTAKMTTATKTSKLCSNQCWQTTRVYYDRNEYFHRIYFVHSRRSLSLHPAQKVNYVHSFVPLSDDKCAH